MDSNEARIKVLQYIVTCYAVMIDDYLRGKISIDEFKERVALMPKIDTPLPSQATAEGAHIWD